MSYYNLKINWMTLKRVVGKYQIHIYLRYFNFLFFLYESSKVIKIKSFYKYFLELNGLTIELLNIE